MNCAHCGDLATQQRRCTGCGLRWALCDDHQRALAGPCTGCRATAWALEPIAPTPFALWGTIGDPPPDPGRSLVSYDDLDTIPMGAPMLLSDTPSGGALGSGPVTSIAPTCAPVAKAVSPDLQVDHVVLFEHPARRRYPGVPAPTAGTLTLRLIMTGGADYGGNGTLRLTAGSAKIYTDAGVTASAAATFDATHPLTVANAALRGGATLYILGAAEGALTLELTLDAQDGWTIGAASTKTATVVKLTLEAWSLSPHERKLNDQRKYANGRKLGVPLPTQWAMRSRVKALRSSPTGHGRLELREAAGRVGLYAQQVRPGVTDAPSQPLGASFDDNDKELWLGGVAAGGTTWLKLCLHLADGTLLDAGDCLKVIPVAQAAISVGLEWENHNLKPQTGWVQCPFEETKKDERKTFGLAGPPGSIVEVFREKPEGLPSKAVAYERVIGGGTVQIACEVSTTLTCYGEFVIGPAYSFTDLEAQLAEVRRIMLLLDHHRGACCALPRNLVWGEDQRGGPRKKGDVWRAAGRLVQLMIDDTWGGTPQATLAVPLSRLPSHLADLDAEDGVAAKAAAETAAERDPDIDDDVLGLIAAVEYYVLTFGDVPSISDPDGPKSETTVMFRSDFCAMYNLLTTAAQQSAFQTWAAAHPMRDHRMLGLLISEWLTSIWAPTDGKDKMSPPPGFPRHGTGEPIPYAMGKMGLDATTSHVIAEWRAMGSTKHGGVGPVATFFRFATEAFEWARRSLLPGAQSWVRDDVSRDWNPIPDRLRTPKNPFTRL